MRFEAAGYTDIGTTKPGNQDSYCIKIADTDMGQVAFVAVADGMGGLQKGELASAAVIRRLSKWFEEDLPLSLEVMQTSISGLEAYLSGQWMGLVQELNLQIMRYGREHHMNLGTTLTAFVTVGGRYSAVHVGDTRIYEITNRGAVTQLTEDQTYVHREVKAGRLKPEEMETHPKRNVLLQCIGSSKTVEPQILHGNLKHDACYLLCSDGFRHKTSNVDLAHAFSALEDANFEENAQLKLKLLTEYNKQAGEQDNITAAVLRVKGGDR